MRNQHTSDASIDDAVDLFRAGRATIEEAAKACGVPLGISDSNDVVRSCRFGFANYLDCVNDAKKHGWKGTPWVFCAQRSIPIVGLENRRD